MNEKHIRNWKVTREKGVVRFILLRGLLAWGLPMFLIMTFLVNKTRLEDVAQLASAAVVWSIGGLIFGGWMWTASEKRFRQQSNGDSTE